MVIGTLGGIAGGVTGLWNYNRDNFLYDRGMRQKQEFKVLGYRNRQAGLWREDVRDLVGLTERKMDSYLIVNTLQLSMCIMLFAEGRLDPGTPDWLLFAYMLSVSGAFSYFLLSMWFAVHASIAAQAASVEILTQRVRLPIPTWEELERMRTYAASFENAGVANMLRVPFASAVLTPSGARSSDPDPPDPWGLEESGEHHHELQGRPEGTRSHIKLVQEASAKYKCHDAFARVCMSFGTNQLLLALCYYCLGYVVVECGAPFAGIVGPGVMVCASMALMQLDFSLTHSELNVARALIASGPACSAVVSVLWAFRTKHAESLSMILLPVSYASHGLWLLWSLNACGVHHVDGHLLPTTFRAVLFMDVFNKISEGREYARRKGEYVGIPQVSKLSDVRGAAVPAEVLSPRTPRSPEVVKSGKGFNEPGLVELQKDIALLQTEKAQLMMTENDRGRVERLAARLRQVEAAHPVKDLQMRTLRIAGAPEESCGPTDVPPPPAKWLKLRTYGDCGTEIPFLLEPQTGEIEFGSVSDVRRDLLSLTLTEEHMKRISKCNHDEVDGENLMSLGGETVTPTEETHRINAIMLPNLVLRCEALATQCFSTSNEALGYTPSRVMQIVNEPTATQPLGDRVTSVSPARLFGSVTTMLACLWGVGFAFSLGTIVGLTAMPELPPLPEGAAPVSNGSDVFESLQGEALSQHSRYLPLLPEGELMQTEWPRHSSFTPRALSCDTTGNNLIVSDDFGIYSSVLGGDRRRLSPEIVRFERAPHCTAVEGQALTDIGVVCPHEASCHVLVLHARGAQVSECPLESRARRLTATKFVAPKSTWEIPKDWLDKESVESMAVNSECFKTKESHRHDRHEADQFNVGCIVVGTTSGRIVQLRQHLANNTKLVPDWAVQSDGNPVGTGSLHVLGGAYMLVLRQDLNTIQALKKGNLYQEWRLPQGITWVTVAAGGRSLFALGQDTSVQLWRFSLPEELQHESRLHEEM